MTLEKISEEILALIEKNKTIAAKSIEGPDPGEFQLICGLISGLRRAREVVDRHIVDRLTKSLAQEKLFLGAHQEKKTLCVHVLGDKMCGVPIDHDAFEGGCDRTIESCRMKFCNEARFVGQEVPA